MVFVRNRANRTELIEVRAGSRLVWDTAREDSGRVTPASQEGEARPPLVCRPSHDPSCSGPGGAVESSSLFFLPSFLPSNRHHLTPHAESTLISPLVMSAPYPTPTGPLLAIVHALKTAANNNVSPSDLVIIFHSARLE